MALERLSPGKYRDTRTGKTYNAKTSADAQRMADADAAKANKPSNKPAKDKNPTNNKKPTTPAPETPTSYTSKDPNIGTVDFSGLPPEKAAALNELLRVMEIGGQFGTNLGNEFFDPNNPAWAHIAETVDPAVLDAMNKAKDLYDQSGITQDELASIQALKETYERAGVRPEEVQLAIDRMAAGLEGMNSDEMTAARELASAGLDSDYATQLAALQTNQARMGARGGVASAQLAQLNRARSEAGRAFQNQFLVDNVQAKQAAQSLYGNYVNDVVGREQAERERASQAYNNGANTTYTNVNTRLSNALDRYSNLAGAKQAYETGAKQYNIGQDQARESGRLGAYLGSMGTLLSGTNQEEMNDFMKTLQEQIMAMTKQNSEAYNNAVRSYNNGGK